MKRSSFIYNLAVASTLLLVVGCSAPPPPPQTPQDPRLTIQPSLRSNIVADGYVKVERNAAGFLSGSVLLRNLSASDDFACEYSIEWTDETGSIIKPLFGDGWEKITIPASSQKTLSGTSHFRTAAEVRFHLRKQK
ncbi:MAG: DUF1425 domain-containing protein [Puniceicoccales bacterium]|jgi:uncharacterized protein YcfL|nr:DUF1425 domain-containing protein [Puniceicoccales bacterium]